MTREQIAARCDRTIELTVKDHPQHEFETQYGVVTHYRWCELEVERIQRGGRRAFLLVNGGGKCCVVVEVGRSQRS